MGKALRRVLKFWKQKDREPEDVSHHFRGQKCISECELFLDNLPLLKAIAYEWLLRNPGTRTIGALASALDIHSQISLRRVLVILNSERKITLSSKYDMLSHGWHSHAEITVNEWLKSAAFEQEPVEVNSDGE